MRRITLLFFIFLISCNSSNSGDPEPTDPNIIYIQSPKSYKLFSQTNNYLSGYDILGDGSLSLSLQQDNRNFSTGGGNYGNASLINGAYTYGDESEHFNFDAKLQIEFITYEISALCTTYTFAKRFEIYNSAIPFTLTSDDYNHFSSGGYISMYNYQPTIPCSENFFSKSEFKNSRYIIFRIKNLNTQTYRYGWAKLYAESTNSVVQMPIIEEFAFSTEFDVLLAPGHH